MKNMKNILISGFVALLLAGCGSFVAVYTAPEKTPVKKAMKLKDGAVKKFWEVFHSGEYHEIANALAWLKASYLTNPNDPELPLYIAHLHFWRVSERFRLGENLSANITDDITIAKKYFIEAKKLNPDDARIDGWLAGAALAEARIHNDEKDLRRAYYDGLDSIKAYPSFNYFSIGYVFSNHDHTHEKFAEAINGYFKSMDLAYHTSVDREHFDIAPYLSMEQAEKDEKLKRAVWNSAIAPHNVEGFYLNFGDFLVKAGRTGQAGIAYANARKSGDYHTWPYKELLEKRIQNIRENVAYFREPVDRRNPTGNFADKRMIFNSYNCMVCHQARYTR